MNSDRIGTLLVVGTMCAVVLCDYRVFISSGSYRLSLLATTPPRVSAVGREIRRTCLNYVTDPPRIRSCSYVTVWSTN